MKLRYLNEMEYLMQKPIFGHQPVRNNGATKKWFDSVKAGGSILPCSLPMGRSARNHEEFTKTDPDRIAGTRPGGFTRPHPEPDFVPAPSTEQGRKNSRHPQLNHRSALSRCCPFAVGAGGDVARAAGGSGSDTHCRPGVG